MSSLGLDLGVGNIPPNAAAVFGSIAMNGDEYVRCLACGYGGCDVRVSGCGCTLHAVSLIDFVTFTLFDRLTRREKDISACGDLNC